MINEEMRKRIEAEATEYCHSHFKDIWGNPATSSTALEAYQAGASRYAAMVEALEEAVNYVERRTDPEQKNPTEHHYIRSTNLRGVILKALARVAEMKNANK